MFPGRRGFWDESRGAALRVPFLFPSPPVTPVGGESPDQETVDNGGPQAGREGSDSELDR